jgi:dipeptide/tripeptide permease
MSSSSASGTTGSEHVGLFDQLQGLDNRFWIVNVMEMFERLAYYGVRAVLAIYIVLPQSMGGPEFTHVQKGTIFAHWAFWQSVLPMFTGGFADRYGHKKTIVVAILIKIVGYILMATRLDYEGFYLGCMLLAIGTAIFKPGVQGTLAATLKAGNASVGWAIFYQLVNIGGFLGPVLAGYLRNTFDWSWVFYSCAIIVSVNFLWLPFYKDTTQDAATRLDDKAQAASFGQLSLSVSRRLAMIWTGIFGVLTVYCTYLAATDGFDKLLTGLLWVLTAGFVTFLGRKDDLDQGRTDPFSVFIVSIVGLFQHRVLWFCLVFAGFWLMFNQVFDLLPNVIDDWVDTSGLIGSAGAAFSTAAIPTALALFLGVVFGGVCGVGVLLAMRPDHRETKDVPLQAFAVVSIALMGAALFPATLAMGAGGTAVAIATAVGIAAAFGARAAGLGAKPLAAGAVLLGTLGAIPVIRNSLMGNADTLTKMAAEGAQVNPEFMINLNPGLIVFTMILFGYLTSFVKPLTSIVIGMVVATAGSVLAGTATVGAACLIGIAVFSIGEMLSSPKKMEFLATLAKKGQEGLFMGYANIPVAIGWVAGSLIAGSAYEENGDKVNLARRHLEQVVGMKAEVVEAIEKSQVVPTLAEKLGMSELELQRFLFETYEPQTLWYSIGAIGLASVVGMVIYALVLRHLDARAATNQTSPQD